MPINVNHYVKNTTSVGSLADAREAILAAAREAQAKDRRDELTVEITGGWYFTPTPLVLSAKENPELRHLKLTLKGRGVEKPFIHSFRRIEGECFTPVEGKPYYTYQIPADETGKYPLFHNLFMNTHSLPSAKSPVWRNPDTISPDERAGKTSRDGFFAPIAIAKQLAEGKLGATELMMYVEWEFVILHVVGADLSDTRDVDGETYARIKTDGEQTSAFCRHCHPELNIGNRETFLQNAPAFLSEPGTYAYDHRTGLLCVVPFEGTPMERSFVQYPVAECYLFLEEMEDVTVTGIEFTATTVKHVCEHKYHSGQANALYEEGSTGDNERRRLDLAAVLTKNVKNLTVHACRFTDIGGNALQLTNATTRARISDCFFRNVGMSAVSVGNPSWSWEKPENRNYAITVENNYFHHIAYDFPSSLAICVGMVDGLKILHNTIDSCGYSGVSVGWGWDRVYYEAGELCNVRAAEIAYNYIHNWMDVLRDGGAIYVVGGNCNIENTARFNFMHHNYARLDVCHDKSKFGYYCDGSSTNWEVRDSVMLGCLRPLFSQCCVARAFTYHNHFRRLYATTPYESYLEAPERDVIFADYFVEENEAALTAAYPAVAEIKQAAGCTLRY